MQKRSGQSNQDERINRSQPARVNIRPSEVVPARLPSTADRSAGRTIVPPQARKMKMKKKQLPPRGPGPSSRRHKMIAVILMAAGLLAFSGLLVHQLYQIQVVQADYYAKLAADQHYTKVTEYPKRGLIYDANGVELAGTTYIYRIGVTPKDVRSLTENVTQDQIAEAIATSLELDLDLVSADLGKTKETYIQLKKDVPREQAETLKAWLSENNIGGVRIDSEPRRYYTNGTLASQVIGYTRFSDSNLIGQLGIELQYNETLTGQPGYTYTETDNYSGRGELPFSVPTSLRAKDGQNLVLSIDINIQKIAQEELAKAISVYDITDGGTIIIMDPYTGYVLAMASYPFFNSEDPTACPVSQDATTWDDTLQENIDYLSSQVWRNRAISDAYEPGSTFKAITASMALEEGLTDESAMFSDDPLPLYGWTIYCSKRVGHGMETMQQGFWRSCNPVFAQLALKVGVDRFYTYVRAFGFMSTTGIDLPAEGTSILHENPTELDMATFSYGESSTVTPLQLATAYCVFANGGNLIRPVIVKEVTDATGSIVTETQPETVRKVISETTAARVRELMKGVVLFGTGSGAYVEGYSIAGKTSTSTDDNGDHTISFAGLAPAESPEIVALVVMNKPRDKATMSAGASKVCGQVISRTLEYLGVARTYSDQDVSRMTATSPVTDVVGMTYADALQALGKADFNVEAGDTAMGDQTIVKYQYPAADTALHSKALIFLYPTETAAEDLVAVPDFSGKTVHECLLSASESGLNILIDGDCLGVAAAQDPAPTFTADGQTVGAGGQTGETGTTETGTGPGDTGTPAAGHLQRGSTVRISFAAVPETEETVPASETTNTLAADGT